jgi:hypothetical protein
MIALLKLKGFFCLKKEHYAEPKWLSEGAKHILRCMLLKQQKARLTAEELLTHSWVLDGMEATTCPLDMNVLGMAEVKLALTAFCF